jgi:hypothetical protein
VRMLPNATGCYEMLPDATENEIFEVGTRLKGRVRG